MPPAGPLALAPKQGREEPAAALAACLPLRRALAFVRPYGFGGLHLADAAPAHGLVVEDVIDVCRPVPRDMFDQTVRKDSRRSSKGDRHA